MSDNNNDKGYSSLSGFKRAVPIILLALAAFIALCFMTKETGALGKFISGLLLGLFARGAYAIPALLAIHAIFYASDVQKSRTVSRFIFSLTALVSVSAFIYTVTNFTSELTFSPKQYYTDGVSGIGGGFIGNTVAFAIIKMFGRVGLIIITMLIVALYISFFFAKGRGAAKKSFYGVLLAFAKAGAKIEKSAVGAVNKFKARKKNKVNKLSRERTDELFDDEYFAVDNGLKELRISALDIHEVRSDRSLEENPTLQSRVRHKSSEDVYAEKEFIKKTDFGTRAESGAQSKSSSAWDDITQAADTKSERASYGLDCSAEEIFTKDFNPIDFADFSEANRPSSKSGSAPSRQDTPEIKETLRPLSEEDIEKARRKADFDMKKRAAFDAFRKEQSNSASGADTNAPQNANQGLHYSEIYGRAEQFISDVKEEYTKSVPFSDYRKEHEPAYQSAYQKEEISHEEKREEPAGDYFYENSDVDEADEKNDGGYSYEPAIPNETYDAPTEEFFYETSAEDSAAEQRTEEPTITLSREMLFPTPDEDEEQDCSYEENFEENAEEYIGADIAEELVGEYSANGNNDIIIDIPEENTDKRIPSASTESAQPARLYTYSDDLKEDAGSKAASEKAEAPSAEDEKPKKKLPDYSDYKFPSLEILGKGDSQYDSNLTEEMEENGNKIIETLASFNVLASIKGYDRGPRITRYEVVPAKGVRVNQVVNLFDDIALSLAAEGIRIEAPIPGKSAIGFELPNKTPETVRLRDLLETDEFKNAPSKTLACIGKDVTGSPVFGDIAKMPHILIAGATGMGKSVCINSILISILYKARPDEVKFILIDPKKVEFKMYNGIPHLLVPVVSDAKQAAGALMWAVEEMERRYDLIEGQNVRNIEGYNEKVRANPKLGEPMPKLIIVIDELNDLMLQVRDPVEGLIMSIAQKARAAGIHLIIGTQRPSVNVITGVIKANIPSRMSCKVASYTDSKTILERAGAERLLDKGDMLYHPVGTPKPVRVQSAFVSDPEVYAVMDALKENAGAVSYDDKVMEDITRAAQRCVKSKGGSADDRDDGDGSQDAANYMHDKQFLDAVDIAVTSGKISTSLIQRRIGVGYGKAAKFIDIMEGLGIVSEPNGQKPRETLITKDDWMERLANY